MLAFPCPACGQKLQVGDEFAGRDCRCPHCQQTVRAPAAGETVGLPTAAAKSAAWPTIPDYELLEELGRGGMGQVFKARHVPLDRPVALKVIRPDKLDANPQAVRRFLHEIRATAKLDHPHLVKVFDAGPLTPTPLPPGERGRGEGAAGYYLSMELIDGIDLAQLVKQQGPLPIDRAVRYLKQAAEGLAYAHLMGLVHRDIKPHNLLLDRKTDQVKILDLGLARMQGEGGSQTSLTDTGTVMGTLDYMAPEQGRNAKGVDGRADLYSLGCTAYYLLTGQPPFTGGTHAELLLAHQLDTPEPVSKRRPDVPAALAAVVARLLAKQPEERYGSATELIAALANGGRQYPEVAPLRERQPPARPPEPATVAYVPRRQPPQPRRGLWLLAGLASVLLLLGVLGYALFSGRPERSSQVNRPPDSRQPAAPAGDRYRNSLGMEFVRVPAGTFWMGGGGGKPGEQKVTIDHDFYLGVYEVTQGQWQAVMDTNPSNFSAAGGGKISLADLAQFPVENPSWDDCQEFVRRLNEREKEAGWEYRLPTEAEWEYACRGAATTREECSYDYYLERPTNALRSQEANFDGNKPSDLAPPGPFLQRTAQVGSYRPNRLGLYDMHGNVSEWCQDLMGGGPARLRRGGCWHDPAANCRAGLRLSNQPVFRSNHIGLRLARVPTGPKPAAAPPQPKPFTPLPGKEYVTNSVGMHFVKIPKGKFTMGAPQKEARSSDDERPQHEVEITLDFYLGIYEVTQEQYQAVVGSNPSAFQGTGLPVENVGWGDADTFCKKLSALDKEREAKRTYRLPTEAEWEYACRAGAKTPFNIQGTDGQSLSSDFANFNGESPYGNAPKGTERGKTTLIGTFPPNDFGLYDMHGNVWEWCQDWYVPYNPEAQQDLQGPPNGTMRILRGGSWHSVGHYCRAAGRVPNDPGSRSFDRGFRVVCVPGTP